MEQNQVVLSSRCRWSTRKLIGSRARLYSDRIEFTGWSLTGRSGRTIALESLVDVEWFTAMRGQPNLRLEMADGSEHVVSVKGAGTWCYEIRRLARLSPDSPTLPSGRRRVKDAA